MPSSALTPRTAAREDNSPAMCELTRPGLGGARGKLARASLKERGMPHSELVSMYPEARFTANVLVHSCQTYPLASVLSPKHLVGRGVGEQKLRCQRVRR